MRNGSQRSVISGRCLLSEQVRVRTCPLEDDDAGFAFVDEDPVRFDGALMPPGKFTFQCVVPESWIERHFLNPVSYTHLRAHETDSYLVCRLLLEKKKTKMR